MFILVKAEFARLSERMTAVRVKAGAWSFSSVNVELDFQILGKSKLSIACVTNVVLDSLVGYIVSD